MKLFILGLIILLILVCQIYKIIKEKNPNIKEKNPNIKKNDMEGFDEYDKNIKHRDELIENTSDYYEKLIDKKDYEMGKKMGSKIGEDFLYLDSMNRLNHDSLYGHAKIEGFHGESSAINGYEDKIDNCRKITECSDLDNDDYKNCGYCGKLGDKEGHQGSVTGGYNQDGKFDYMPDAMGGKQVGPDVCPSDALEAHPPKTSNAKKPLGNRWATTAYECKKIQAQDKCSEVRNCGDLNNAEFSECGWCPADKAYPKNLESDGLLYPNTTQTKGDSCAALNETYTDASGNLKPYFSKLQKADACSSCDNSGGQIFVDNKPKWSDVCIQDLWKSRVQGSDADNSANKLIVECSTPYDSPPGLDAGGIYYKNYGDKEESGRPDTSWGYEKWYKVRNDMQNEVTYPIFNFKKDYNVQYIGDNQFKLGDKFEDLDKETGQPEYIDIRRSYIMNSEVYDNASKFKDSYHKYPNLRIDQKWKQCFNKENKNNELKCVPVKELQDLENIVFPTETDGLTYTDLDNWKTWCNELKNNNKCEVNAPYPNGSLFGGKIMCEELN